MTDDSCKEFFAMYHSAVFEALGSDAAKYNARIGALLAQRWLKNRVPFDSKGFKEALEAHISGPLKFSEVARFEFDGSGAYLYVKGCNICRGNEILRSNGLSGSCPISQFVKSATGRALKKSVELTGIEKPGPVGECYLRYKIF